MPSFFGLRRIRLRSAQLSNLPSARATVHRDLENFSPTHDSENETIAVCRPECTDCHQVKKSVHISTFSSLRFKLSRISAGKR